MNDIYKRDRGGRFAETVHAEPAGVMLAGTSHPPELEPFWPIPDPLPGQTLVNGSSAEGSFEDSYREYFRELNEHEATHGPYVPGPGITEETMLDLAGLQGVPLGRHRGTSLERDEATGNPIIVVHSRNGGGNRECWSDDCGGDCTGCIQTDRLPAHPTYLGDADDEDDCTYANTYFRPVDAAAGTAALEAEEQRGRLHRAAYDRNAIIAGTQPPWIILSPVRGDAERDDLRYGLQKTREQAQYRTRDRRTAAAVTEALDGGTVLPSAGMMRVPDAYYSYGTALKYVAKEEPGAAAARAAADDLGAELAQPLPPAIKALAAREHERLVKDAVKAEARAEETKAKLQQATEALRGWTRIVDRNADEADAKVTDAQMKLQDFDWSAAYPGEAEDCPPRPAPQIEPGSRT